MKKNVVIIGSVIVASIIALGLTCILNNRDSGNKSDVGDYIESMQEIEKPSVVEEQTTEEYTAEQEVVTVEKPHTEDEFAKSIQVEEEFPDFIKVSKPYKSFKKSEYFYNDIDWNIRSANGMFMIDAVDSEYIYEISAEELDNIVYVTVYDLDRNVIAEY